MLVPRVGLDARSRSDLRKSLRRWFRRVRRDLPWRRDRDPYKVWVSEVMLQQTRIAVVAPAFERFVTRFPDLAALAGADEEDVLSLWSGLGYYSRARNLQRAARRLVADGGGEFPRSMKEARELPGVGAYTAAAVLSIAFDYPAATVDGNVARVLSRVWRLPLPDSRGEPHAGLAHDLLDRKRPGDWNQALMELGETVCLPAIPACDRCPWRRRCEANRHGDVDAYPHRKAARQRESVEVRMVLVGTRRGDLLLERGAFPYLPHLWLPPLAQGPLTDEGEKLACEFRHAITHRDFRVRVTRRWVSSSVLRSMTGADGNVERRIFTPAAIQAIGRSGMLTKALRGLGGME